MSDQNEMNKPESCDDLPVRMFNPEFDFDPQLLESLTIPVEVQQIACARIRDTLERELMGVVDEELSNAAQNVYSSVSGKGLSTRFSLAFTEFMALLAKRVEGTANMLLSMIGNDMVDKYPFADKPQRGTPPLSKLQVFIDRSEGASKCVLPAEVGDIYRPLELSNSPNLPPETKRKRAGITEWLSDHEHVTRRDADSYLVKKMSNELVVHPELLRGTAKLGSSVVDQLCLDADIALDNLLATDNPTQEQKDIVLALQKRAFLAAADAEIIKSMDMECPQHLYAESQQPMHEEENEG